MTALTNFFKMYVAGKLDDMTSEEIEAFKEKELSSVEELREYCEHALGNDEDEGLTLSNIYLIWDICDSVDWHLVWRESLAYVADSAPGGRKT